MTALEFLTVQAWRAWAVWQKYSRCDGCREMKYVGRTAGGTLWLCVDCWEERQ